MQGQHSRTMKGKLSFVVFLLLCPKRFSNADCSLKLQQNIVFTIDQQIQLNFSLDAGNSSSSFPAIKVAHAKDGIPIFYYCSIDETTPDCEHDHKTTCCTSPNSEYQLRKTAEWKDSGRWKLWIEGSRRACYVDVLIQEISSSTEDYSSTEKISFTMDYASIFTVRGTTHVPPPPLSSATNTPLIQTTTVQNLMTPALLGINVAVLVVVVGLILLVAVTRKGAILRRNSFRRSLSFRLSSARIMQGHRRWRLFSHRNRRRDVCMRKPSNHPLALPEPPVALSPNDYDLINDDHIVVGEDAQGATARPTPFLPRSDYLHPIPAPEDVFGDFKGRGVEETKGATGISKEAAATPLNCAVRSVYLNPTPSDVDRHQTVQKLTEDAQTLDFTGQGARPKTNWRLARNNRLDSASPNKAPQSQPVTIPKTPMRLPLRGNCLSFPSNYVRSETWTDHTDQVGHKEEDSDQVEAVPLPPKRPPRKDLLNLNPQNENRLTSLPLCPEIEVKRPDGGIQQSPARPPPRLPSRKGRHQTTKQRQAKEVQKEDVGCQDVPSPCTFKTSEQSSLSGQELLEVLKRRQKQDTNLD